ncbi:MAG: Gldg family protein [Planctomycetia bacterium]|nr:Gldg family protein [Planctomycetia bacterium]
MIESMLSLPTFTEYWLAGLGLAAFLAVFWVLRGAPVGQAVRPEEDEDAPGGGYRDRVVTAASVGLLLILYGAYLAVSRGVAWSLPAFALGFGTVLFLVINNQRHRHASPVLRRTVDVSTAALNASLFAGILVVVNVIAFRYGGRALDLTRESSYSLSSLSVKQVVTLKRPVTFTTFFGRSPMAVQQYERVRELLDLYKAVNPSMVRLDHVNPFTDQSRYEALAKRVPDVEVTLSQGGGVVVEYGEGESSDRVVLRNIDLFEIPRDVRFNPNVESFRSDFKGEDAVTSALIRLRESKRPKVVFTTGHGEPSLDSMGNDRTGPGMGVWKSRLTGTGSDVVPVNLQTEEIPDDAALVVVGGPKTPFRPDEAARLKAYAARKLPLLLLVGDTESTGLEDLLMGFNVAVGKGFIVEPRLNDRSRPDALAVQVVNPRHPILDPLAGFALFFFRASPLKILSGNQALPSGAEFVTTPLLRTSPQSWAEPDLKTSKPAKDPDDEAGPMVVAVAVNERPKQGENQPGAARLVVFSSRNVGDNRSVQVDPENLDLVMNAVNWLRGRPDLEGIAPKTHVSLTLTADPLVRTRLILVPTVMSVLLILTLGAATYLSRRD